MSSAQATSRSDPNKCVVIGDACVGKTCMVARLTGQESKVDGEYVPTIVDNTVISGNSRGQQYRLEICDTAGQEEYACLRTASYNSVDVFLLCFCLVTRDSFENLETTWLPELLKYQGKAKVILVGTKLDLCRPRGVSQGGAPAQRAAISEHEISALRNKHNFEYVECSALTGQGIQDVLDKILQALFGVEGADGKNKGRRGIRLKKCSIL